MKHDDSGFDAVLSAATDGDAVLHAELRACFIASMENHIHLLQRARCDGNWHLAARRLLGLGSSFHASGLIALAHEADESAPGDPAILRKLHEFAGAFAGRT